eukprot:363042-Hanusia_phi.AAC.2
MHQTSKGKCLDPVGAQHREVGVQERRSRFVPPFLPRAHTDTPCPTVSEWREGNGHMQHHYQVRSGPMQDSYKVDDRRNYHLPMSACESSCELGAHDADALSADPMRPPTAAAVVAGLHGYGGVKRKLSDPPVQSAPRVTFHNSVKYADQKGSGKDKNGAKETSDKEELKFEDCLEVKPRPRRRSWGQGSKQTLGGRPQNDQDASIVPVKLSTDLLRQHFNMPLNEAARKLGICATAIKKVRTWCKRGGGPDRSARSAARWASDSGRSSA